MLDWQEYKKAFYIFGGASLAGNGGGYGFGDLSKTQSFELLDCAEALGVKVFDLAPIYGFGNAHQVLSEWTQSGGRSRGHYFIIDKYGVDWHPSRRVNMDTSFYCAEKMLNQSLNWLKTDYLDLFLLHWPDDQGEWLKTWERAQAFVDDGRVRYLGLCNVNLEQLKQALKIARPEVVQGEWSLFAPQHEELIGFCQELGILFDAWGVLMKGILPGSVYSGRHFSKNDARSWAPWWKKSKPEEQIKKLKSWRDQTTSGEGFFSEHPLFLAKAAPLLKNLAPQQWPLLWAFYKGFELGIHAPVVGTTSAAQLRENYQFCSALSVELPG